MDPLCGGRMDPLCGGRTDPLCGGRMDPLCGGRMDPLCGGRTDPLFGRRTDPLCGGRMDPLCGGRTDPLFGGKTDPLFGGRTDVVVVVDAGDTITPSEQGLVSILCELYTAKTMEERVKGVKLLNFSIPTTYVHVHTYIRMYMNECIVNSH